MKFNKTVLMTLSLFIYVHIQSSDYKRCDSIAVECIKLLELILFVIMIMHLFPSRQCEQHQYMQPLKNICISFFISIWNILWVIKLLKFMLQKFQCQVNIFGFISPCIISSCLFLYTVDNIANIWNCFLFSLQVI